MKKTFTLAAAVVALSAGSVFAQAPAPSPTVDFKMTADFASLRPKTDKKAPAAMDVIDIEFSHATGRTKLKLECQPGETTLLVRRRDRACKVTGDGWITNPKNGEQLHRVKYEGGLVTNSEGYTDARNLKVIYLAVNGGASTSAEFTGALLLKPEKTPQDAMAFVNGMVNKVTKAGEGLIDTRVDIIGYRKFGTPSQGLNTDRGCVWNDNMGWSYQSELWRMDLKAACPTKDGKSQEFKFSGNMPYSEESGPNGEAQYKLTLTPPSASATSDDALFNSNSDDDLFASADGISATINMVEDQVVEVLVDGKKTENASHIEATAKFTGTNVPATLLNSFVMGLSINAVAVFGP
ncbi:MAG: hypothetical protein EOP85_15610 [Verrucomicrobiaceae bacterium]|nr:MAG: hypothetical protein EOP85_15610 [Verrucomicrobiaceae bacterium]